MAVHAPSGAAAKKKIRRLGVIRRYLLMFRQGNVTWRQIPHLLREWRLWMRITRNFSEIEGSWVRGPLHLLRLFQGYPEREDQRKIHLPAHVKRQR